METREQRINRHLDEHFKSNKGNFAVQAYANPDLVSSVSLSYDCRRRENINPKWIALYILRTEPAVQYVDYGTTVYTRNTLRRAGHKI